MYSITPIRPRLNPQKVALLKPVTKHISSIHISAHQITIRFPSSVIVLAHRILAHFRRRSPEMMIFVISIITVTKNLIHLTLMIIIHFHLIILTSSILCRLFCTYGLLYQIFKPLYLFLPLRLILFT